MFYHTFNIWKMSFKCRKNIVDPEDPRCARLVLTGQMVAVSPEEVEFAKQAMFSRLVYGLRGFPLWLSLKESACNARDMDSISGPGSKIPHAVGQPHPSSSTTEPAHHNQDPVQPNKQAARWDAETSCQPCQKNKTQRHHLAKKGPPSQINGFSSSQVWMWELDHNSSAECQRVDAFKL